MIPGGRSRRRPALILGIIAVVLGLAGLVIDDPADRAAAETRVASGPRDHVELVYRPPVEAHVVDGFRMDNGPYGPGNRGLEYATVGGEPVVATADGRVTFVGMVAGRLVVSLGHADGRLSSLTYMSTVTVSVGEDVEGGAVVGAAAKGLHFGVRENGVYIDPISLFHSSGENSPRGVAYLVEP